MKKTLIALAALSAIAGAAQAQSTVTLYGRLDAAVASTSTTDAAGVKLTKTAVNSSDLNSTFWGLKGSEDLGGGLKANFKMESRFQMDTGVGTAGMFDREANVGLSGAFGAVSLGRVLTSYDDFHGAVNNVYNSNFATTGDVNKGTGLINYAGTVSNGIKYVSPVFSGVSGGVVLSFGEDKTTTTSASSTNDLYIKYAQGPLLVGYAYQAAKAGATSVTTKYNLFGGSYDFGVAKLTGGYSTVKMAATKDKEYQVGVSVPFGAAALAAGYSHSNTETAGVESNGKGFSLVATYDLSKRTTVYAGYENVKLEAPVNFTAPAVVSYKTTNLAAGIRHTF